MPGELRDHAFLDALLEERHVVGALLQHRPEDVLQQRLGERRVVGEIGERDLRLDHPELGQVPAGVGILGAERGAERVDLGQREAVGLDVELARHREKGLAAEEILRVVDLAGGVARQVHVIERRHAEHLAGPLGVGGRDDRRVHPVEPVRVEEPVDRMRDRMAHAGQRADDVRARPQVGDVAQELERVRLRLDRIGIRILDPADHADRIGLHLERLPLRRRRHDRAGGLHRAAGREVHDVGRRNWRACSARPPGRGESTSRRRRARRRCPPSNRVACAPSP